MKSIEITFKLDGTSEVEAIGFQGKGCQQATQPFEEALGKVTSDRQTADYYKASTGLAQKQTT